MLRPTFRGIGGRLPAPAALHGSTKTSSPAPAGAGGRGYLPVPLQEAPPGTLKDAASRAWVGRAVDTVNSILRGKMNVVLPVTLQANSASTTIIDPRIGAFSALLFSPLSADAAAEIPTLFVSAQKSGEATLTHADNGQTDRYFNMAIFG